MIAILIVLFLAVLVGRYLIPAGPGTSPAASVLPNTESATTPESESSPNPEHSPHASAPGVAEKGTGVFINGRELKREQVMAIAGAYHYAPYPGRYWYDTVSGAWGVEGRETAGFLMPGHDFGHLAASASAGNTGVFVNGRELNLAEALGIQRTFGAVYRGRWWLDGRTGNYGMEGNPMPLGNMVAMLQAKQSRGSGDNFWCSATACGNDNGQSGYVDVGGTIVGYDH